MNGQETGRPAAHAGRNPEAGNQRFPSTARLLAARQYKRVFKRSSRSTDRHFIILARPNQLAHARLGLAIAVKASGNAVQRNRVKRVVRESFRMARQSLPPVDLVVMVKPGVRQTDSAILRASLNRHWKEIERRCAS